MLSYETSRKQTVLLSFIPRLCNPNDNTQGRKPLDGGLETGVGAQQVWFGGQPWVALRKSPNLSVVLLPSGGAVGVIRSCDTGENRNEVLSTPCRSVPLSSGHSLVSRGTKGSVLPVCQYIWVPGPGYR